jgi:serine phosphatase RsbU (regulator of sigma subunit)
VSKHSQPDFLPITPGIAEEYTARARVAADRMASSARLASAEPAPGPTNGAKRDWGFHSGGFLDPARLKTLIIRLLKILIVIELVSALIEGVSSKEWSRFGLDLIVAGILYMTWEKAQSLIREKKEATRRQMETSPHDIRLWDALIFSLLWTDEIYSEIPPDRRRLVVIAYTLIGLGTAVAFIKIGAGLMPLVIAGALVLGAANLVVWVVSVERGERESLRTELSLAHDVQMSLMPKEHPAIPGFDIAGVSIPARDVGGDLFDYATLGDNGAPLGIAVVDVSGKGMQAAMSAVYMSGAFASEARQSASPAAVLSRLNGAVSSHARRGHFIAFLLAALDPAERTLRFANAGQTKPLLASPDGVRWLDCVGVHFPLGLRAGTQYEECTVQLRSGDLLVLLTDGFTDAMNAHQELFGNERMEALVHDSSIASLPARDILDRMVGAVRAHAGAMPQHDDMTMVVIKVS